MPLANLDQLALLKISGEDALPFLQGQLTNDVAALDQNWQYAGYCNPKGRLLALFILWREQDHFYALTDKSLIEATTKRLRMYVLRSKVNIEVIESAHCYGTNSDELTELFNRHASLLKNGEMCDMLSIDETHFALSFKQRAILVTLQEQPANATEVTPANNWIADEIAAGLPWVNQDTSELFIPQMLNLDILDGISFKKGCYTGQEIVARMHYLGKLKQRMFLCTVDRADHAVKPGDKVILDDGSHKNIGNVISALQGHANILAVLRVDAAKNADLKLDSGPTIAVQAKQPYQIPLPE